MKNITTWEYSVKTEAERLIYCAHQIIVGFYKTNNFIVLPYNPNIDKAHIVTFPDLKYTKIPRFWEQAKKVDVNNKLVSDNQYLVTSISNIIQEAKLEKVDFKKTKELWTKVQNQVLNEIYRVLPSKKNVIKKILIYPTTFGTNCSFNWIDEKGEIIIYLREDQGIHAITEAIITSLTRDDVYIPLFFQFVAS